MSQNRTNTRSARSNSKCETINKNSDADEEFKFKQEESMDTNISEASTLDLDETEDSERLNLPSKRKHNIPPLLISNLPQNYSLLQITDYLEKLVGPCEVTFSENRSGNRTVEIVYTNMPRRSKAKKILNAQCIDKVKLRAETPDYDLEMEADDCGPQAKRKKEREDASWGVDMDVWRPDPKGWYGVKPQYLTTLGINEPLQNWVLVLNFRCGREELKELLELAGDVLVCSIQSQSTSKRYANVMYRHPLEALQAVSMFNGQMFYGRPLTVKIIKATGVILPKGLNNIGPGLAKYGKPLRDVVRHYERFIKGQDSGLNNNLFRTPQEQCSNDDDAYLDIQDNDRKAREALESLVNLVAQGMKVKDLVEELKSIIADIKENPIERILKELENIESIKDSNENNTSDRNVSKDENENGRSSSVNSNSRGSVKSATASPDYSKTSKDVAENTTTSRSISTVSSNRSSESGATLLSGPKTPAAPGSAPRGSLGDKRHAAPGLSGPSGPMPGPIRPICPGGPRFGPSGPMPGPMGGPMPGPMGGPMMGPMPCPMPGPMSGPMPGPMSGPNSGPMRGPMPGPMSGPNSGPMPGPMSGLMSAPNSGPMPGSISRPMSGPMSGPNGPMAISGRPLSGPAGPMSGPMPGPNFSMRGPNNHPPFGPSLNPTSGPEATLQFSNLPPSTTFALLSDKLSQVGQLVSIQFTVPGCVVVKFAHRSHAERCLQQFDKTRLEGNLIDVRFI